MVPRPRGLRPSHGRPRSLSPNLVPEEGVWAAASACQRRPGSTGRFGKDYKPARPSRAEGSPQASGQRRHRGGGAFRPWVRTRATGGARGQAAAAMGQEFRQRGASVRSAHCFRVSPDPGESWSTAMGSGRRHRQDGAGAAKGKIVSILRYDSPQGRLSEACEGFSPVVSHV